MEPLQKLLEQALQQISEGDQYEADYVTNCYKSALAYLEALNKGMDLEDDYED